MTAQEWLHFAQSLLSAEETGMALEEAAPVPPPGQIGAVAGFGRVARDCDVRVSAYVFDEWAGGSDVMDDLRAAAEAQGRHARAIVNGSILVVATAGPDDRDAAGLAQLWTAFSFPR